MATVPVGIIQAVTAAVGRPELLMVLIAGVGEVDSAAPSMALWELGRVVAASPELSVAFDSGVTGLLERLERSGSQAAQAFLVGFRAFVHDYGSRGPNEWETRSPTWETRPELALAAIDRMRLAPDAASPDAHQSARSAERQATAAEVLAAVAADEATHAQLAAGAPGGHGLAAGAGADEDQQHPPDPRGADGDARARPADGGAGRLRRGRGLRLPPPGRVQGAFLTDPHALHRRDPPAPDRATASCRTWSRRSSSSATRRIPRRGPGGTPPCSRGWVRARRSQGVPGCSGVAEGRARVVLDSNDPTALDPGDVLVAPITDPSWTPLFVPAAAVVVDVGAPLSHAVIVSRELGIPCVVSATGATRAIPDGAMVRVDGSTGLVTVL